jgi:hypothetical protein
MTIRSAPYYWVACDCCEERVDYGDKSVSKPQETWMSGSAAWHADFQTVDVAGVEQQLCPNCWEWPEDVPGYDEATSTSDDPVRAHDQHPVKAAGL